MIAIEQQAHGRTSDIERPLTYAQMADDTTALLRRLEVGDADFYCYSMGSGIAVELALRQSAYKEVAPEPENWPGLVGKCNRLDIEFEGWSDEQISSIDKPVLLIIGDSDIVRPEHAVELFRLLGGGVEGTTASLPRSQLALLPGTTHLSVVECQDWLVSMISNFLDGPINQ